MSGREREGAGPAQTAPDLWQVRIVGARALVDAVEALTEDALSVSTMREVDAAGTETGAWVLEALYGALPDRAALEAGAAVAAGALGEPAPAVDCAPLAPRDWLAENQAALPLFDIGRFRIVPEHRRAEAAPSHRLDIVLDAGPAFGSGTHETTQSCLYFMERLARQSRPSRILDLGTGSGILAMAAVLLWRAPVVATDIDPVAVRTTMENAGRNGCAPWIDARPGPGVRPVVRDGPFDLVIANILAGPLAALAPALAPVVTPGGHLVLSGILSIQENGVLTRYAAAGFRLVERRIAGEWSSFLMRRPCART